MRFLARVAALILPLAVLVTSCDSDDGGPLGTGRVSVVLRDAPGDLKAAVVTISKVYLQGTAGEVLLTDAAVTTDLLTLRNDFRTLVDNAVIPAGSYSQLRFVIDGAYIEVEDEFGGTIIYATNGYEEVPAGAQIAGKLQTPSLDVSGLKVDLDGGAIRVDGEKILLVDFDVRQSFGKVSGHSGQWVMDPVVRATDVELTGRVRVVAEVAAGVRFPPVAGAPVTLGDLKLRLESEESGAEILLKLSAPGNKVIVEVGYLFPGTYSLELLAPGGIELVTTPPLPLQVEVGSGSVVEKEVRIVQATAGPAE
jgi:hypothetical protein